MLDTGMVNATGSLLFGESFPERAPQASLAVLASLIDRGLLAVVDDIVNSILEPSDNEKFKIPSPLFPKQEFQSTHYYSFIVAMVADQVFPRDSWAWTLWRESALVVAGIGNYAGNELAKLMSDDRCGPSSYWLLAELLNSIQRPVGPIAERGLGKFNRRAFIREWETALGRDLHPSVADMFSVLQSLSDDDVTKLAALAEGPLLDWIRIAGRLRAGNDSSSSDTTADLLKGIWSTELRDRLEQRLRQLASPIRVSATPGKWELK